MTLDYIIYPRGELEYFENWIFEFQKYKFYFGNTYTLFVCPSEFSVKKTVMIWAVEKNNFFDSIYTSIFVRILSFYISENITYFQTKILSSNLDVCIQLLIFLHIIWRQKKGIILPTVRRISIFWKLKFKIKKYKFDFGNTYTWFVRPCEFLVKKSLWFGL